MRRRTFIRSLGAAAALPAAYSWAESPNALVSTVGTTPKSQSLAEIFYKQNDEIIAKGISNQALATDSPFRGGFPNEHGIFYTGAAAWQSCYLAAGLISPESSYYQSELGEERLDLAVDFISRMQHEDGTTDLVSTNFHSPPDTGFLVEPLALALSCVRKHQPEGLKTFQSGAEKVLESAGHALARGGVHTPNHRWVVSRALARINDLLPGKHLLNRIDQWLAEGIDIDADGQFTERSTSGYTPLVNRCFLTMARLLNRPELFEPVRRNLDLTRYLMRPNGELVTEISRRQDRYLLRLPQRYYLPYCYLARIDNNGDFAAMARFIEEKVGLEQLARDYLYTLEDPQALAPLPAATTVPENYERYFPSLEIVRIRRNSLDATLLSGNSTCFSLHKGKAILQSMRLASAFFGKGQFVGDELRQTEGGYQLTQRLVGPYIQPLPPELIPGDGDWHKLPHEERQQSEVQQLTTKITVHETDGKFRVRFHSEGTERVPWAIELGLRAGGELTGVTAVDEAPKSYLADTGKFSYRVGKDVIQFSGSAPQHQWTQLRGALPKLDTESVYLTGFTPLDFELTIS